MKDITFCPKPGCNNAMISGVDDTGNDLMMKCSVCNFTYCIKCKEEWHADSTCEQYQTWKLENNQSEKNTQSGLNKTQRLARNAILQLRKMVAVII